MLIIFFAQIIGSFSQAYCFPRAVAYLDSGKIRVKGMVSHSTFVFNNLSRLFHIKVTDVFKLVDFQQALDKMSSRAALKIAIKP